MYELARGPLTVISMLVFVLGTLYQVFRFYSLSRRASISYSFPVSSPRKRLSISCIFDLVKEIRHTVFAVHPLTMGVSTLFHLFLILTPLLLLGHNELLSISWGVALFSLPEKASDFLTVMVLLCCAFFLFRRIFLPRVRCITSVYDYLVLALATVPFLSGFLAYHQIGEYRTVMMVHMLSGEVMLMAIPFTKLTHMVFFFFNRFLIVNEHTLGKGSRTW